MSGRLPYLLGKLWAFRVLCGINTQIPCLCPISQSGIIMRAWNDLFGMQPTFFIN